MASRSSSEGGELETKRCGTGEGGRRPPVLRFFGLPTARTVLKMDDARLFSVGVSISR